MHHDIRTITPDVYETDDYVVLDFETDTSHGDYGHPVHKDNGIILACWRRSYGDAVFSEMHERWADEYGLDDLVADIEDSSLLVCHNGKYELGWLVRCGLDLGKVLLFDTKLAEYVLMGNLAAGDDLNAPRDTSLNACGIRRGMPQKDPVVDTLIGHAVNPVNIPRPWLAGRCRQDVDTTEQLFLHQRRELKRTGRLGVALTRNILTPVLAESEMVGMRLDPVRVEKAYNEHLAQLGQLSAEMDAITGGLNWKSGPQVAEFLYNDPQPRPKYDDEERPVWLVPNRAGRMIEVAEGTEAYEKLMAAKRAALLKAGNDRDVAEDFRTRAMTRPGLGFLEVRNHKGEPKRTPTGVRRLKDGTVKKTGGQKLTDQKTIDVLEARTDAQRKFVEVRKKLGKVNAALTKSLYFFQGVCKEHGGVFHAEINQTKTATHRTSSTGIPLVFKMYAKEGEENTSKSAQFQNLPNAFKPLFCARGYNK